MYGEWFNLVTTLNGIPYVLIFLQTHRFIRLACHGRPLGSAGDAVDVLTYKRVHWETPNYESPKHAKRIFPMDEKPHGVGL